MSGAVLTVGGRRRNKRGAASRRGKRAADDALAQRIIALENELASAGGAPACLAPIGGGQLLACFGVSLDMNRSPTWPALAVVSDEMPSDASPFDDPAAKGNEFVFDFDAD